MTDEGQNILRLFPFVMDEQFRRPLKEEEELLIIFVKSFGSSAIRSDQMRRCEHVIDAVDEILQSFVDFNRRNGLEEFLILIERRWSAQMGQNDTGG